MSFLFSFSFFFGGFLLFFAVFPLYRQVYGLRLHFVLMPSLVPWLFSLCLGGLYPPIFGGGFSVGGSSVMPVGILAEETKLFPTGSRELSGASLSACLWTRSDTWATVGRS